MAKRPPRSTTEVSYTPGSDWFMFRGKKLLSAWRVNRRGGRIAIGCWKELPPARGERFRHWADGQEMRLTPEEALDLGYALGFMAHQADPDVKEKHRQWKAHGRRRAPSLRLIRGGAGGVTSADVDRDEGTSDA
jgi:hypothetical protein